MGSVVIQLYAGECMPSVDQALDSEVWISWSVNADWLGAPRLRTLRGYALLVHAI